MVAGLALGFAVAAGFGPISVLALTSGLRYGFGPAFGVGLGAALVDGLYALLAAAEERGATFVKGTDFLLDGGRSTLRMAYSGVRVDQIEEGVTRIADALRSLTVAAG